MSNLYMNRLDELIEPAKSIAKKMIEEANKQGIYVCITSAYRSKAQQNKLYAQGRTVPGAKVTNAKGGQSIHNYRLAWDICPVIGKKLEWGRLDLFAKLGSIGKKCGAVWGGDFKSFIDRPHFQATAGLSLRDLQRGKRPSQSPIVYHKNPKSVEYRFKPRGKTKRYIEAVQHTFDEQIKPDTLRNPLYVDVKGIWPFRYLQSTVAIKYEQELIRSILAWRGKIIGHSYHF